MRIYGPSITEQHLRCPLYRKLREQWAPKTDGWSPHILAGTAIHAAMARFLRGGTAQEATQAMTDVLVEGWVGCDEFTLQGVAQLCAKGLKLGLEQAQLILDTETIVQVDEGDDLPHEDRETTGNIDLVTRIPEGLVVTDWKTSLKVDPKYVPKRLAEYDTSHQLWQYSWKAEAERGEKVAYYRIGQFVLSPRTMFALTPFKVEEDRLKFWYDGAVVHWGHMEAIDAGTLPAAANFTSCHNKYGRCEMYDACHQFGLDSGRMSVFYDRINGGN